MGNSIEIAAAAKIASLAAFIELELLYSFIPKSIGTLWSISFGERRVDGYHTITEGKNWGCDVVTSPILKIAGLLYSSRSFPKRSKGIKYTKSLLSN
ncbi:hypothetical protein [Sporosarcina sp. FSL K6-2383]|uniref:hypothetical protein n=1 Tax=Sporosarcina sp. FSL K6-2383 TaxID=2921556 RepID=UPI003159D097